MKYFLITAALSCFSVVCSQNNEGFWDNSRTTNETVILNAGKRKIIKTSDFPSGTTEVVYRISLLDDNQKISSSLVSLLKSIPDPTGISQGTAGAVFLASTISGDDKCKFAIFSTENDALQYGKTGMAKNACLVQDEPVSKAGSLLSEKSRCMAQANGSLWFGFQSDNFIMKEKIVLEVVPWVDYSMRNGWTSDRKKELLLLMEKLDIAQKVSKKDLFFGNFISILIAKYSYADYKKLLSVEKSKLFNDLTQESLVKSGQLDDYLNSVRNEANKLVFTDKTDEGVSMVKKEIVDKNRAVSDDYFLMGNLYLSSKQFVKAEGFFKKAIEMNASEVSYQLKLAHVYMFTDRLSKAKEIHEKFSKNYLANNKSWTAQTKEDFQKFEQNGFDSQYFKKVLRVLE